MTPQEMEATVLSGLLVGGATPDALDVIATMPEEAFSIRFHRETYREIKTGADSWRDRRGADQRISRRR